jgi:5-methylcytosine-specific restriction protein A
MKTYLLTWNPDRWPWDDLPEEAAYFREKGELPGRWSCGNNRSVRVGDRVFLMRQHVEPRGIIASGWVTRGSYKGVHWEDRRKSALYVQRRFEVFLEPGVDAILARNMLFRADLSDVHWDTQSSGIEIPPRAAAVLERIWRAFVSHKKGAVISLAEEIRRPSLYSEGTSKKIRVNVYERDPQARRECIKHHGLKCSVCSFDFEAFYGEHGRGFIHVHHLKPLSTVKRGYKVNPVKDLRPICPNCHAMIHGGEDMLGIAQLKRLIRSNRQI